MAVCMRYLGFRGGGGLWWSKKFIPPCPPNRGSTVPYLPKIYRKPCTWWQELNLELSFETQNHLLKFLEVLNLLIACICN